MSSNLIQQTKTYVTNTLIAVKDALGFDHHPQSKVLHNKQYLNDISRGHWKTLNHVTTCSVKYYPVVGFPLNFRWPQTKKFNTNFSRYPFLEQVKQGKVLKPVVTIDKTKLNCKDYKYRQRGNRKELLKDIRNFTTTLKRTYDQEYLNDISRGKWKSLTHIPTAVERQNLLKEIEEFSRSDLKRVSLKPGLMEKAKDFVEEKVEQVKEALGLDVHPQGKVEHVREYLNDIAKGNWDSLNHVSDVCEKKVPVVGVEGVDLGWNKDVKIKMNSRHELLEKVKEGCDLKHVKTHEKNQLKVGAGYKMKPGVDRKQLLNEIQEFEGNLAHVGSS